jgi:hypothetical protein
MPPNQAPNESREAAAIRWLTRVIAALVHQSPEGAVNVSREALAADYGDASLVEREDEDGDIVFELDVPRKMAIYPLNGGVRWDETTAKTENQMPAAASSPAFLTDSMQHDLFPNMNGSAPGVTSPKDQEKIRKMEQLVKQHEFLNRVAIGKLKKSQDRNRSLEGLLEQSEMLGTK